MAVGDPWLRAAQSSQYASDSLGVTYRHRVNSIVFGQAATGWPARDATVKQTIPRNLKPRVWIMKLAGTPPTYLRTIIATETAWAAGVIGTTTLLLEHLAVQTTFTLDSKEGERHRGTPS